MQNSSLLVIASHDSQLKVASHVARQFVENGWDLVVRVPLVRGHRIRDQQVEEFSGFSKFVYCNANTSEMLEGFLGFDAVLVILEGQRFQEVSYKFFKDVSALHGVSRPVLVTGFVGVGLFDTAIGYQRRLLSDVLFLNARKDLDDCVSICRELGVNHGGLVVSGLPFLGKLPENAGRKREINGVLFAGQPDVPSRIIERLYLLEQMIEYARCFPYRNVYFKPRHRPTERSLHRTDYHYQTLLEAFFKAKDIPENFHLAYGSIDGYLEKCQILVTVSSTAVLEALEREMSAVVICDLGISEDYGNNFFMGSGLLSTFEALLSDEIPSVDLNWLNHHVETHGAAARAVFEATLRAIETNSRDYALPYSLQPIWRQAEIRLLLERSNKSRVRKPWSILKFFLWRMFRERRLT